MQRERDNVRVAHTGYSFRNIEHIMTPRTRATNDGFAVHDIGIHFDALMAHGVLGNRSRFLAKDPAFVFVSIYRTKRALSAITLPCPPTAVMGRRSWCSQRYQTSSTSSIVISTGLSPRISRPSAMPPV